MIGTKRLMRFGLLTFAVVAAAWLGARAVASYRGVSAEGVPTATVRKEHFVRAVLADGVLRPVKTTAVSAPSEARDSLMVVWIAEDGARVKKGDVIVRLDPGEVSRKLADLESDKAAAEGRIERERLLADSAMEERDRSAGITNQEMEISKQLGKLDPRYFPRAEIIQSELDESLHEKRLQHADASRRIEEKLTRSKLELLGVDRKKAEEQRVKTKEILEALEVRAPHDGTFTLRRWGRERSRSGRGSVGAGDRVHPGMRIGEVSMSDKMQAEVFVLEADAGGLVSGKTAEVVLEARPDVIWKAKVRKVDALPGRRQADVPAQYFKTILELQGDVAGLKPEQPVRARIFVEEHANALVVPRQSVFHRDNTSLVYRQRSGRFVPVEVKVGAGTVGRLMVLSGLNEGDVLALRDPTLGKDELAGAKSGSAGAPGAGGAGPKGLLP